MNISSIATVNSLLIYGYVWRVGNNGNSYFALYDNPNSIKKIIDADLVDESILRPFMKKFPNVLDSLSRRDGFCEVKYDFDKRDYVAQILKVECSGPYLEESYYKVINEGLGEDVISSLRLLDEDLKENCKHRLVRVNKGGKV